jgi:signal transduction histidine kinase
LGALRRPPELRSTVSLFDTVRFPVFVLDRQGSILRSNRAADDLIALGHAAQTNSFELDDSLRPWAAGEPGPRSTELYIAGRHFCATLDPLDDGADAERLCVLTDITEQKRLAAQLQRAQRLESLGTIASGIAHDLNNVLTPIGLVVDLLPELGEPFQQQALLQTLRHSVERGGALIQQILSFARGKDGDRQPVQLRRIVIETTQILKQTLPRSIAIVVDIPTDLWSVVGDETQLGQVVLNLAVNARDAMPDGGHLRFAAANVTLNEETMGQHLGARPGRHVMLAVADSGCGIEPEVIERIFDPFFTTKALGDGTGLGLSTVLEIVHRHAGFLDVESHVGSGSTFKVYLPASDVPVAANDPERPLPAGHGELILVVDDEGSIREIATATLEAFGYRALAAADGAEAVGVYARLKDEIAAVVVDLMMPAIDGTTTMRALRNINPDVRVVAMSGLRPPSETCPFLGKPFTARQLLEAISGVLSP